MSCALEVRNIRVRSLSVDYNEVSWEIVPTAEDVLDYTFQVFRSEAAMGPFSEVSNAFEDRYLFVDNVVKALHRHRQYHYQIRVTYKPSGEYTDFGPALMGQDEDLIARELRSHIGLLMQEFIGERCWLLPVRTFGQRCPSCWSVSLNKKHRSGCRTCYDTGFIRGYMHPIETWVSIDPTAATEQFTNVGKTQQNNTTARMPYFPPLKPGDLLVSAADNARHKVVQVSSTKHVGTPIHQEVQLHEVPQSAIEYAIPLQLAEPLKNMFLKPARNFTNPQQLEAVDDTTTAGIFSIYSVRPLQ